MAGHGLFKVPTIVLIDQARSILDQLASNGAAAHRSRIRACGFDPDDLIGRLRAAVDEAAEAEAQQERLKTRVKLERAEDRRAAEEGFRWIRSLHLRLKLADDRGLSGEINIRRRFRASQLVRPTVRGVVYEMRILLHQVDSLGDRLLAFGLDPGFLQRGRDLLASLEGDRTETVHAIAHRERLTARVRRYEGRLTALLRELRVVGQVVEIETGVPLIGTDLPMLRAHVGRWKTRHPQEPPASQVVDVPDEPVDS